MENVFSAGPKVRIVLSSAHTGLERLGKELASRLPDVQLGKVPDAQADINYYIPLSGRSTPASTYEIGWVQSDAELEPQELNLVICPDAAVQTSLVQAGMEEVVVISPGLAEGALENDLVVGVVGQEDDALVAQVTQISGVAWRYIGTDPSHDLFDICRSVDYLLVPRPSVEGLSLASAAWAVGTPVIAEDAAGLGALAQSVFRTGDVDDLLRVLLACRTTKHTQCRVAESHTWDVFADAHARVFAKCADMSEFPHDVGNATGSVRLLLHGVEHKALGGPSVRVPRTAQVLRSQGIAAKASVYTSAAKIAEPLVHLFNVWDPASALSALQQLKAAGKRVVFSPIYLDLQALSFWQAKLPELPLEDLDAYAAEYRKALMHLEGRGRLFEPLAGYNAMVRAMLDMADHVIFLSQAERDMLEELGAKVEDSRASLVPNPVDVTLWQTGDPALFRNAYLKDLSGPQEYVICVGRIEERKNQLLLARAMRDLPLRLVLVGHEGNPAYAERVRREAGPDFLIVDRLEAGGEMLRSAVAGARVFCLPSWAEGASLAALEAAAAGAQMVLGDRSSERTYFGDLAEYCDVGDPRSITAAICNCLDRSSAEVTSRAQALKTKVAREYSWQAHAASTAQAYARASEGPYRAIDPALSGLGRPEVRGRLVLDLTALAHDAKAHDPSVHALALLVDALRDVVPDLRFVCWIDNLARFVDLPDTAASVISTWRYCMQLTDSPHTPQTCLTPDCTLVVAGDIWRQNAEYLSGLADLKARSGCALVPLVHDLDPLAFPFHYNAADAAAFQHGFHRLVRMADGFLPATQAIARRTHDVVARLLTDVPPITPLQLGDAIYVEAGENEPSMLNKAFGTRRYILVAGPVEARANLGMLIRIWARFADMGLHEDLHLVIAGDVAPRACDIPDRIARDTRLAQRIHLLSGLKTGDLDWLYRNCLFTVFPANDTDWAAPVAQSLTYAKPCLATSTGAAREIARDLVEHIDPDDFTAWYDQISRYATSAAVRYARTQAIARDYSAVLWKEAAQALVEIIQEPRAVRGPVPVFAGAPIDAGTQGDLMQALFCEGWHPRESWGRWAAAKCCEVTINLKRQVLDGVKQIHILMHLNLCPGSDRAGQLTVRAGERVLFRAPAVGNPDVNAKMCCDIILSVPADALDMQSCVKLTFDMPLAWEKTETPDTARQLGIGVQRIVVLDQALCNPLHALRDPGLWSTGDTGLMIDMVETTHRAAINAFGIGGTHEFSPAWGLGGRTGCCDIAVPVLPGAPAQTLRITCRPVATKDHPVVAEFYWDDHRVAEARWTDDKTAHIEIALSERDMAEHAPHVLTVRSNSLLMPVDLGLGLTERIAGVGIFDVELVPEAQIV